MGDLRDQLKKANLLSKKDDKRIQHEQRVHRKEVGRAGLEQEEAARRAELERIQQQGREATRAQQAELERSRRDAAELAACEDLLSQARSAAPGGFVWHFELSDGQLPHLRLRDADAAQLARGALAIVRTGKPGTHVYGLLETGLASRVVASLPDRVVWLHASVRGGA